MVCELSMQCDLIYRFLKCALPVVTIDVDLMVHNLKEIHMFKKDYRFQTSKCNPWGADVHPYPSLKKKMVEFMWLKASNNYPLYQQALPSQT